MEVGAFLTMSDANLISEEIQDAAAAWLARRDRGLTATEQDAYLEWLYRDPAHGKAIVLLERAWGSLNQLEQWRPVHSAVPNPDLLAPRFPVKYFRLGVALAAAAAIGVAFYAWSPTRTELAAPRRTAVIHPAAERQVLEDGSVIELNTGARVEVQFTPTERRVRLSKGEAHFTVAKNPTRPFIVRADKVAVQAVGTAFSMSLGLKEVSVVVTEGKVRVDEVSAPTAAGDGTPAPAQPTPSFLIAGQQAVIPRTASAAGRFQVSDLTPAEIERVLDWQGMRLGFAEMPLRDVVDNFNRYNHTQLAVADEATGAILVDGNFRADNVDAFVRLLESSFSVQAARHGNRIVLRHAP